MNWKLFGTMTALIGVGTSIALAQGTAPTIVQGDYISNVFGNSNFVKNPNAKLNTKDITTVTATVTRSTTTPLVATSEFNVAIGTANGTATWATRAFDAGMKNNNCEARFSYRGFQATSKVHIKQGANTVASLNLTPATDPRIASINFPCGDLSNPTTFVVTDTAILAGTNEIGGIYVGLATNMANVAQAEFVGQSGYGTGADLSFETTSATHADLIAVQTSSSTENEGSASSPSTVAGVTPLQTTISNPKPGNYYVTFSGPLRHDNVGIAGSCAFRLVAIVNGIEVAQGPDQAALYLNTAGQNEVSIGGNASLAYQLTTASSLSFKLKGRLASGGGVCRARIDPTGSGATRMKFTVHRFPSASELVVTPERQNVFGAARYFGANIVESKFSGVASNASNYVTVGTGSGAQNWSTVRTLKGKAVAPSTTSSQALGLRIPSLPVGNFLITIRGDFKAAYPNNGNWYSVCGFDIFEATTSTSVSTNNSIANSTPVSTLVFANPQSNLRGVFTNTSVADREFVLRAAKTQDATSGTLGTCDIVSSIANSGTISEVTIDVIPLDQPSNSALYVQGPVLGAQTGAAIPAGYVNEFATRSISDSSLHTVATPVLGTVYYPWTGELTLPAGNWNICYRAAIRLDQSNSATNVAQIFTRLDNKTDGTNVFNNATWPTINNSTTGVESVLATHFGCQPIAITTSKVFRVGIQAFTLLGTPTVGALQLRGDLVKSELYAIRLN